jgi:hypothetical protein
VNIRNHKVNLNAEQVVAVATHFARYVKGYKDDGSTGVKEESSIQDMIHGWADFKKAVGNDMALKVFWLWARTLPEFKYGMCDPDGN